MAISTASNERPTIIVDREKGEEKEKESVILLIRESEISRKIKT